MSSREELNVMIGNESVCFDFSLNITCHLSPFWFHMQSGKSDLEESTQTWGLRVIQARPEMGGGQTGPGCSWRPGFKFPGQSFRKSTETLRRTHD
ncbi:hypothetical protein K439DRAFT_1626285 [Ramaria rubella]|nr:hypothetical protein K439DRAFT_1626285 [Ramaria rubella]